MFYARERFMNDQQQARKRIYAFSTKAQRDAWVAAPGQHGESPRDISGPFTVDRRALLARYVRSPYHLIRELA